MGIIKGKPPIGLYVTLGVLAIGAGVYGKMRLDAQNKLMAEADSPDRGSGLKYRAAIQPEEGTWQPTISRLRLPSFRVVDMTDNGVFLLLIDEGKTKNEKVDDALVNLQTFQLFSEKGTSQIDTKLGESRLALSPDGLVQVFAHSIQDYWTLHYEQKGFTVIDATAIRRTMSDGSKIGVIGKGVVITKNGTSRIIYAPHLVPTSQENQTLARASSLSVVEHGDDDSVWIFENGGQNSSKFKPRLVRVKGSQTTEYKLPFNDTYVQSLAQTGETIIATMGSLTDKEPNRAYRWTNDEWDELPIPDGYTFSMVRKITSDGLAIGIVRDLGLKTAPVVWNGKQCFLLNKSTNWPKYDLGTQIIAAARNGNIYVQPNFDRPPGSIQEAPIDLNENSYVLSIKK